MVIILLAPMLFKFLCSLPKFTQLSKMSKKPLYSSFFQSWPLAVTPMMTRLWFGPE